MRLSFALPIVVLGVVTTSIASAEPSAQDKAAAETLFRDARALLKRGEVSEACNKLEASQQLDPQSGTLVNLAACHEKEGKTASAWAEFTEVVERDERGAEKERAAFARKHAAALEKNLSRLRLSVPEGEILVKVGGRQVARTALSSSLPVDPGEVVVEASSRGKTTWTRTVRVEPGPGTTELTIPPLADTPVASDAAAAPALAPAVPPPLTMPSQAEGPTGVGAPAIVAFAVGAVGLGVGTYFGLQAFSKKDEADKSCPVLGQCTQRGLDLDGEARTNATVATIGFAVAGVAVATGVVLLLTSKRPSSAALVLPTHKGWAGGLNVAF